jgi:DNA-binding beta-propeller fold protein YncE
MRALTTGVGAILIYICGGAAAAPKEPAAPSPLRLVADIPMPGAAVRFDYQSLDPVSGRLYIAHMNADQLVVFDTRSRQVVANLDGFARVHGVWAVPALGRVYASATGDHAVAVVDMKSLKTLAKVGPVTSIPLGGEAGNTVYDPGSRRILVAVHDPSELVAIDPAAARIVARYPLPGLKEPHGVSLDVRQRLAFVAGQANRTLVVFDLTTTKVLATHPVGEGPDVLAFDPGLGRLYVSSESGVVSVFRERGRSLVLEGELAMPHAHTVCVDPATHLVYFPLESIEGRPILRIMEPS